MAAQIERDRVAERGRDVKADQRARGRYPGGKRPFGFLIEDGALVPNPEEGSAIKTMVELRELGFSLRNIATQVELEHGFHLSHEAVRRVLADEAAKA